MPMRTQFRGFILFCLLLSSVLLLPMILLVYLPNPREVENYRPLLLLIGL